MPVHAVTVPYIVETADAGDSADDDLSYKELLQLSSAAAATAGLVTGQGIEYIIPVIHRRVFLSPGASAPAPRARRPARCRRRRAWVPN